MTSNIGKLKKEYICPNCRGELQFSLRKQVVGNNCACGFPQKYQRTKWYLFKNWLFFKFK